MEALQDLMDLPKAFDCLNHELLIAKLDAYCFSRSALVFIYSFIHNRKQTVKVNGSFMMRVKTIEETIEEVPERSVLGTLLINIYLKDLFMLMEETEVCNYGDSAPICACGPKIETLLMHLDAIKIKETMSLN